MATLPDLDTATTSFVAYWNALDHGVNDINPDDVLSHGNIQSYDLYDNGVIVQYAGANGRTFTVRVKEDGWFVAYLDRTAESLQTNDSPPRGPWDVINGWTSYSSTGSITQNTLERAINALQSELGNSGSITYATADVGLYNYEHTSATTVSMVAQAETADNTGTTNTITPRFSYTSDTTIEWAWAQGVARLPDTNGSEEGEVAWSDGTRITYIIAGDAHYGSLELLSAGRIPNAATNYGHDLTLTTGSNSYTLYVTAHALIMWS